MEEDMWEMPLKDTYHIMVTIGRYIYITHLTRMMLLKGKIKPLLKMKGVFFMRKEYQEKFGKKLSATQIIF